MEPGGYAWWYVDGLSDDGRHAITLIAFVGSVFSPYYRFSGRRNPENHSALNVAIYSPGCSRWAMTERRSNVLARSPTALTIARSNMWWNGRALEIEIDETTSPIPSRIKGVVRLHPIALTGRSFLLDPGGRHEWWPIAPLARIEVELQQPALKWSGAGYFDTNHGSEPLENGFARWDWCRATHGKGSTMLYEVTLPDGRQGALTLLADPAGRVETLDSTRNVSLPRSPVWRIDRGTRSDNAATATVVRTLEDTPFYARSKVATRLAGENVLAMHESLSLERFRTSIVQFMLPWRMPRAIW